MLTGPDGKPFDFFDETKGKLAFLFFGYTNCPDVCPVHMASCRKSSPGPACRPPR
ncbi:MAG: SCO family protein [Candidatus Microthrix sp.]|uniref:SCO family protein n=1 Tax=Candidatus Neomicrothrix sp. TaxID=2719034 RepID=UPI0025C63375|nr:SCO family protein [Candidatus Microthrix sp.]MBL0204770.1 SCO family protein [Candidatus Microthrix sp.]